MNLFRNLFKIKGNEVDDRIDVLVDKIWNCWCNYAEDDAIYALPVLTQINVANYTFQSVISIDRSFDPDTDLLISFVTASFLASDKCITVLKQSDRIRKISVIFEDEVFSEIENREIFGEAIYVSRLGMDVYNDYLVSNLFFEESLKRTCIFGKYQHNRLVDCLLATIAGSYPGQKEIKVGDVDTVILFVGSFAYSMFSIMNTNGYRLPEVIVIKKNKSISKGQNTSVIKHKEWIFDLDQSRNANMNLELKKLNNDIRFYLQKIDVSKKIVLVGGLGKTSSLLLPMISNVLKQTGYRHSVVAVLPHSFEPKTNKYLSKVAVNLLKLTCSQVILYDNIGTPSELKKGKINIFMDMLAYAIVQGINKVDTDLEQGIYELALRKLSDEDGETLGGWREYRVILKQWKGEGIL